jgi:hypothetical protein
MRKFLIALVLTVCISPVYGASVSYDETFDGDVSSHESLGTELIFDVGLNSVRGEYFDLDGDDNDNFSFIIPEGMNVQEIVAEYTMLGRLIMQQVDLFYKPDSGHTAVSLGFSFFCSGFSHANCVSSPGHPFGLGPFDSGIYKIVYGGGLFSSEFPASVGEGVAWEYQISVASTAVPIPAAIWLFGSALGLLGWIRRKAT